MNAVNGIDVTVTQARLEADGVVSLQLRGTSPLPAWTAGAHIDLALPSGLVRQYSLCGMPDDADYTVAILDHPQGRGGSREIHSTALVGQQLTIAGPRNHFALDPAESYVFIAGGIGITPLLAMIRRVTTDGVPWQLHYGGRSTSSLVFTDQLRWLADRSNARLTIHTDDVAGPLPLAEIVADAPDSTAVYACGPPGMITALNDTAARLRPDLDIHVERFTTDPTATAAGDDDPGDFVVELASTGETVAVPAGTSVLDAVRALRPDILSSCEEGFCGTCETKVLDGTPVHRDTILSERERKRSSSMMICVSGCASERLILDM